MPELLSNYPDDSSDLIEQDNVYPDNDDVVREQILERQQILERVNSILSDMVRHFYTPDFAQSLLKYQFKIRNVFGVKRLHYPGNSNYGFLQVCRFLQMSGHLASLSYIALFSS